MLPDNQMDNYIAKLSAYLASELSQETELSIVESMNLVIASDLYKKLTDPAHHHYRMSLNEAFDRLKSELTFISP